MERFKIYRLRRICFEKNCIWNTYLFPLLISTISIKIHFLQSIWQYIHINKYLTRKQNILFFERPLFLKTPDSFNKIDRIFFYNWHGCSKCRFCLIFNNESYSSVILHVNVATSWNVRPISSFGGSHEAVPRVSLNLDHIAEYAMPFFAWVVKLFQY